EGVREVITLVVVEAAFTCCESDALLIPKCVSPLYAALTLWLPRLSVAGVKLAEPLARATVKELPSIVNVMLPVADGSLTVAVNVTAWPNTEGLTDDVSVEVVSIL